MWSCMKRQSKVAPRAGLQGVQAPAAGRPTPHAPVTKLRRLLRCPMAAQRQMLQMHGHLHARAAQATANPEARGGLLRHAYM